jgi:hypothetical protein
MHVSPILKCFNLFQHAFCVLGIGIIMTPRSQEARKVASGATHATYERHQFVVSTKMPVHIELLSGAIFKVHCDRLFQTAHPTHFLQNLVQASIFYFPCISNQVESC